VALDCDIVALDGDRILLVPTEEEVCSVASCRWYTKLMQSTCCRWSTNLHVLCILLHIVFLLICVQVSSGALSTTLSAHIQFVACFLSWLVTHADLVHAFIQ
jgi:hypothetical protein